MRIAKSQAVMVLKAENDMLRTQRSRCESQVRHLRGMTLRGLKGKAAFELERSCQSHAAIVASHVVFYCALLEANAQNIALVEGLPETSSGVLDTNVAERRLADAQARVAELQQEQEKALNLAKKTNEKMQAAMSFGAQGAAIVMSSTIDTAVIREEYESLMRAEELIAQLNREILDKATTYDRTSASLYESVGTDVLRCSKAAGSRYVRTGTWGDDSWMAPIRAATLFARGKNRQEDGGKASRYVDAFLNGDLKLEKSLANDGAQANIEYHGIPITGAVAGSALGLELSLKPNAKQEKSKDSESAKRPWLGTTAKAEVYGAKGEATGSVGAVRGSAEVTALSGAASGTVGASLFKNGTFDPALKLGAKAEVGALEAKADVQVGSGSYNAHAKAEGQVLTASAEAGIELSDERVEAKAGAEAYMATGEIAAGLTLMGVKVDVALEGKAGGAGAHANASVGTTCVEGSVGAGLGLGAGVKVKVDWSGAGQALSHLGEGNADWWDNTKRDSEE